MTERPEQLPEGRLIALAQKRARLSGRKAADRAGMSEGHWRAIVSGSRSISAGVWVRVSAPAETLARMAQVVGVTAEQLRKAGRLDAAEELLAVDGDRHARTGYGTDSADSAREWPTEDAVRRSGLSEDTKRALIDMQRSVARAVEAVNEPGLRRTTRVVPALLDEEEQDAG